MTDSNIYVASAGQTHIPFQENSGVPFVKYDKPALPDPPLPPLELTEEAKAKGYTLPSQRHHFLPGLTSEMLDWFWANMEKGYYLWAPGSHKRFNWLRTPYEYGFEDSVHIIAETTDPALPVFGGEGVEIHRLHLTDFYPFTTALKHVICEGVFNDAGELVDSTVHEWEDVPGGIVHITATVQNSKASMPPRFVLDILRDDPDAKLVPNFATDHENYEASQWPVFLPELYDLWKDHPDHSQNVQCNLEVEKGEDGRYHYKNLRPIPAGQAHK
ncbi:MAG: glycogen debranching protein [Mogibacterium sp.]|nr:glycogen debranching protein [Mogibacterium sp.]